MSRANPATNHQYAGVAAWRVKLAAEIHSYADALAFLGGEDAVDMRIGREKKLAASMTVLRMYDDPEGRKRIAIRLYSTNILVYREDEMFFADNGGYNTPTTSTRLNMVAPRGWFFSHHKKKLIGNFGAAMGPDKWYKVAEPKEKADAGA